MTRPFDLHYLHFHDRRDAPRDEIPPTAPGTDSERIRRVSAIHCRRGLLRWRRPPTAGEALLCAGRRRTQSRHDAGEVSARPRHRRRDPRRRPGAQQLRLTDRGPQARAHPGTCGHRTDQPAGQRRPRRGRLPRRAVHAVVPQGTGRRGRDHHHAREDRRPRRREPVQSRRISSPANWPARVPPTRPRPRPPAATSSRQASASWPESRPAPVNPFCNQSLVRPG